MKQIYLLLTTLLLVHVQVFGQNGCFRELSLSSHLNYSLTSEGFNIPRGNVTLGSVPFQIPLQGNT
ncbi:MAG: hypothetical protein ACKO9W_10525, partial [Bacteroidota bacterium]